MVPQIAARENIKGGKNVLKITFKIGLELNYLRIFEFKKIVLILPLIRSFLSRATVRTRRALRNPIPRRKTERQRIWL